MPEVRIHGWIWCLPILVASGCGGGAPEASSGEEASDGPLPTASGDGTVLRLDSRFASLVSPGALIERVAEGFEFVEGPVWIREDDRLVFSDLGGNAIYEWTEEGGAEILIDPYFDDDTEGLAAFHASNGITRDAEGRLVIGDHGRRQVTRIEEDGSLIALVDQHDGARLKQPE